MNRVSGTYKTLTKDLIFMSSGFQKDKKERLGLKTYHKK